MSKQKKITIDFSGSLTIDAQVIEFINVETEEVISGAEYLKLNKRDAQDFVVKNMDDAITHANDIEWSTIDL